MQTLLRLTSDVVTGWHRFWFSPKDPLPLCVMRLAVGAMLFYTHLIWSIDLVGFFGASGWNNEGILATLQRDSLSWSLWWWVPQHAAYHFHAICLVVLFLFWMGVATRVTSVLAWVITVSYAHRSMLANFGLDQISAMLAFYLMLAPCGARLSVDRWWRARRKPSETPVPSSAAALATRLIQVHICVIYFWAGLSKLQGASWWTGDAVWQVIANHEYQSFDLTWLANYPTVLQLATHGVLLFEISFPFIVFQPRLRPVALLLGTLLHLGIGAFFGMWTFGLIMICGYLAFFDEVTIRRVASAVGNLFRRESGTQSEEPRVTSPVGEGTDVLVPGTNLIPSSVAEDLVGQTPDSDAVPASMDETSTVRIASHSLGKEPDVPQGRRRRYVADKLFYVARSKQQRANVRVYFQRHKIPCSVLRGAAELIERTVNLRKATIVLRAKDFSLAELQFWCDELVETNPDGQFRVFLLPDTKQPNNAKGLDVPPRIRLFRLSATTTLRRIRKLYENQDWESTTVADEADVSVPLRSKSIRTARLMSLLLMVLVLAGCGAKKNTPKVQLERARMMLDRGQLHEAVQTFSAALTASPGNADDYYDRGVAYERLEQLEQAAADYSEALRLNPTHAQALNNRAVVLAQLGRVDEALRDLSQAIELNPADSLAWGNRGLALHESGEYAGAIADYSQALGLNPEARLHFQRGNVYVDFDQPERAVEDFTAALSMDTGFIRAYLNRANAFVQLGRLDEAVNDLQTASEMDRELSMAGAVQQLERQIRSERWRETAAAGMQPWLSELGYEILPAQDEDLSRFVVHRQSDTVEEGIPCLISSTGPRGAPVFEASLSERLLKHERAVALFVVDKKELVQNSSFDSAEQPTWLKDWRFEWKPLASDFIPSQVEVLLGPPAD